MKVRVSLIEINIISEMSFGLEVKVLIVGHSYVRRLCEWISKEMEEDFVSRVAMDFNLYQENVDIFLAVMNLGGYFRTLYVCFWK